MTWRRLRDDGATQDDYEGRNSSGPSLEWLRGYETRHLLPPTPDPYRAAVTYLNRGGTRSEQRAARNARYRASGDVTADDVARLRGEQGDQCAYCGADLHGGGCLDHIDPVAHGGTSDVGNMAWSCQTCNARKADKTPIEWEAERWLAMP